jgi:CubicO group peptidase (beta-lactamase class C family)
MENALPEKLKDFDTYMEQLVKDWNAPGVGVGIVVDDKLVFTKGYGYRDYEQHLPFTPTTLCPIASNTKLFTAVAAGLLVADGQLTWDTPVRDAVPSIRFYNGALNNTVTLRTCWLIAPASLDTTRSGMNRTSAARNSSSD